MFLRLGIVNTFLYHPPNAKFCDTTLQKKQIKIKTKEKKENPLLFVFAFFFNSLQKIRKKNKKSKFY